MMKMIWSSYVHHKSMRGENISFWTQIVACIVLPSKQLSEFSLTGVSYWHAVSIQLEKKRLKFMPSMVSPTQFHINYLIDFQSPGVGDLELLFLFHLDTQAVEGQ